MTYADILRYLLANNAPTIRLATEANGKLVFATPAEIRDILKTQQKLTEFCNPSINDNEYYFVTRGCIEKFLKWAGVNKLSNYPKPLIKNSRGQFIQRDCDDFSSIIDGEIKRYLYCSLALGRIKGQAKQETKLHQWYWYIEYIYGSKKLWWVEPQKNIFTEPDFNRPVYFVDT